MVGKKNRERREAKKKKKQTVGGSRGEGR